MKRIISLLLSGAMTAMLLLGCGSAADQVPPTETEAPNLVANGEAAVNQAAPVRISVYPADLRFTHYAELVLPPEEPAADPTEPSVPETGTSKEPGEMETAENQLSGLDGNKNPGQNDGPGTDISGSLTDPGDEEHEVISNLKAYRYEASDSTEEEPVYRIQVEFSIDENRFIISGKLLGAAVVKWNDSAYEKLAENQELPDRLAEAFTEDLVWQSCGLTSGYATDLRLTRYMKQDRNVIYTNEENTMFQLQSYDETGAMIDILHLSEDSVNALESNATQPIFWLDAQNGYLELNATSDEAPGDGQLQEQIDEYQKKLDALQAQSGKDRVKILVLAGAAIVLLAVCVLLLQKQNRRRNGRAAKQNVAESPAAAGAVRSVGTLQNIGKRSGQQDSFNVVNCAAGTLAVVADGMGGLSDGDKVSRKIVSTMCADAARIQAGNTDNVLCQMVAHANQEVNRMLGAAKQYKSGSTLLAVLVEKGHMQWITVGDSRIYLYRGGSLIQINREHIYRVELLQQAINGKTTFANALRDPQSERLSSFIGMGELKHVDICLERIKLQSGDRILLMSDGVFNTLSNAEIASVIRSSGDASAAAANLEQRVLQKGAPNQDNFTCVILEI